MIAKVFSAVKMWKSVVSDEDFSSESYYAANKSSVCWIRTLLSLLPCEASRDVRPHRKEESSPVFFTGKGGRDSQFTGENVEKKKFQLSFECMMVTAFRWGALPLHESEREKHFVLGETCALAALN